MNEQCYVGTDSVWQRLSRICRGMSATPGRRQRVVVCFWKPFSGRFGLARHGATCRRLSATGTASSGGSADGPRRVYSRVFSMRCVVTPTSNARENCGAKLNPGRAAALAVRAAQKSSTFSLLVAAGRARRITPRNFSGRSGWRAARV